MLQPQAIPEVLLYTPKRFSDHRGWFSETYNAQVWAEAIGEVVFVQDNQSFSANCYTMRALHYQVPPKAQHKLVRVLRGAILDVAVDLRRSSPTFGQHVAATLSAENGAQLFVPIGFAHGFLTLEPNTEVLYKVSEFYSKDHEAGLVWNDLALAIDWGVSAEELTIVARDAELPKLADAPVHFA